MEDSYSDVSELSIVSEAEIAYKAMSDLIDAEFIVMLKEESDLTDEELAEALSINVKTLRTYKKNNIELKDNMKEHIYLLRELFRLGLNVFASKSLFRSWLFSDNYHLDGEKPLKFLTTVSGIRFLKSRLIGMEFGDNV